MRVHTHDYSRDSLLLNAKGFGKREGSYRLSLSPIPFPIMFALMWYVFVICGGKGMHIQCKT